MLVVLIVVEKMLSEVVFVMVGMAPFETATSFSEKSGARNSWVNRSAGALLVYDVALVDGPLVASLPLILPLSRCDGGKLDIVLPSSSAVKLLLDSVLERGSPGASCPFDCGRTSVAGGSRIGAGFSFDGFSNTKSFLLSL